MNMRLGGKRQKNVSTLDANIRAIERLINVAASEEAGLISVYRAPDENEKRMLAASEADGIANAYRVELQGDDKVYYITYKPQVEHSRASTLEHLNRSTPFVQMLLDRIENEYSFLYCHSSSRAQTASDPPAAKGFTVERGETERLGGKSKYELFFLIECKDGIDSGERIANIIDSVLLDVDADSGDFFAHMSYAPLEHAAEDEEEAPIVADDERNRLNTVITQIRDAAPVRQRILDFLADCPQSELYAYLKARDRSFESLRAAAPDEINALNSSVVCRMMPIGVFLNAVDNDRVYYTVRGGGGEARFFTDMDPTTAFSAHRCPHCGKELTQENGAVAVKTHEGFRVGCEACASHCAHKNCRSYVFDADGCAVCHKILCPDHAHKSMDSSDSLCDDCVRVFRDSVTNAPLSPRDAAVRGEEEFFVEKEVGRLGKTGALNFFKTQKLLRKCDCARARTRGGAYRYYLRRECKTCAVCGEPFYKADIKRTQDTGEDRCFLHRVDCGCGAVVARENAHMCAESGCEHGFCETCYGKRKIPNGYRAAARLSESKKVVPVSVGDEVYCPEHVAVCKVCGAPVALSRARVCRDCGGIYCNKCGTADKCNTCVTAASVTPANYKSVSSPTRLRRLNALPVGEKSGRVAVIEDHEDVVFVSMGKSYPHSSARHCYVHHKLTGKTEVKR